MANKALEIEEVITPDVKATTIANQYVSWEHARQKKISDWTEVSQYVYATDTTMTRNSQLPWSNKTTIPKLCQIADNLYANYMASLFPKRKWQVWEGDNENDENINKRKAIESYMRWVTDTNQFYDEFGKAVSDLVHKGNMFLTAEWVDARNPRASNPGLVNSQFVGPVLRRISPLDIVFDASAPSFDEAPKIVRSFISLGEVREMMDAVGNSPEEQDYLSALWNYMNEVRNQCAAYDGNVQAKDTIYNIQGFDDYRGYLSSNLVEVLTYYGNVYDHEKMELQRNQIVKVVDRHKILSQMDNPSMTGKAPIYHVGWRNQPDNLWAMGPLENLVGMQYRIDHVENLKADLFDFTAMPPLKVKGYVEPFEWAPMERIDVGDSGDVEMMIPRTDALQYNTEIVVLEAKMEEMAGAPKEAMGFRTPGEKTAYEVQRIENAASRIFQSKIIQIERQGLERVLNYMLDLARRNVDSATVRIINEEDGLPDFLTVTASDIAGNGRIKPVAAQHFAERAEFIQNITNFYNSGIGNDPEVRMHMSSVKLAKMIEDILDLDSYAIVEPYIRLNEQQQIQRMAALMQENHQVELQTAPGIAEGDIGDQSFLEEGNIEGGDEEDLPAMGSAPF